MEIAGIGVSAQTNVSAANTQTKQQTYAQPASQQQSQQNAETTAKAPVSSSNNDSVKVTITSEGKNMLNNSKQNVAATGGDTANNLANLAQGNNTQPGTQAGTPSEKSAKDNNQINPPAPPVSSLFSNSAYYSVEKNAKDNTQSVVVKIVDSNGNVVRSIPPEDLLKSASELNIGPNNLYHSLT
ncbi:MAG: flagellar protein FlaG [Nitrospirae bacterium]|nr:flagellar protein FlaG [Nitrospirota bacterium]